MDNSHDFKVNKNTIKQLDKSSNEVKILVTSFENLIDEIGCQLEIIKEKTEILEEKNQKLLISEKDLFESNKVKDKFFSILAHDLRGPFATIQSFLDLLVNHAGSLTKEETIKLAKEMSISVEGLSELLENLLEWSISQKGYIKYNPEVVNIKDVVDKNIQIIYVRASIKNITIQSDPAIDLFAYADYNMVDFVIRNLLSNAIKFTSPNGKVLIDLKEKETFLEISIIDNGIGLSIDDQQKLFRSDIQFSRMGTSKERGTGLGLILCKEFIEKCSGKVSLESKQGEGATFKFTLPLHNN